LRDQHRITNLPLIVVGGGGHAKVLVSTLFLLRQKVLGFVDLNRSMPPLFGIANLGDDDAVFAHSPDQVRLVNGVGSTSSTIQRQRIYEKFVKRGFVFESVIHPSAMVAPEVEIGAGVQIMAGAVLQPGTSLGDNVIVNTGACVDHDCLIEAHAHIAPRAVLSGNVHIGRGSHIGTGATIIQGIRVGAAAIVGAGAVVIRAVPDEVTVAGVPAEIVTHRVTSRPEGTRC
jgi:sugar O-acyltransferase (sialic acid O-acetyltransferase NeuD family)